MRQRTLVSVAVALIVGATVVLPAAGTAAIGGDSPAIGEGSTTDANETAIPAGDRLQGIVGVQEAEVEGELRSRSFDVAFAAADTNASKARVVADRTARLRERIEALERRKRTLREARANGSIDRGEFRAEMAELAAELATIRRLANQTETASRRLPAAAFESAGVNVTAIRALRRNAADLAGPEIAAIARSVAGRNAGRTLDRGNPPVAADRGRPTDASGAIRRAEVEVRTARKRVERADRRVGGNASTNATGALSAAQEALAEAEEALRKAREALNADDRERAIELAREAIDHAGEAVEHAEEAMEASGRRGREGGSGG